MGKMLQDECSSTRVVCLAMVGIRDSNKAEVVEIDLPMLLNGCPSMEKLR